MDVVSRAKRKKMMSGIRNKNTRPEMLVRRSLHKMGFRYRLHSRGLPGRPDLVFPKYRAVVLVNGCFWHGHDCHLFKWPKTREGFWKDKINRNIERDSQNNRLLENGGWRICTVWECALKGKKRQDFNEMFPRLGQWLKSSVQELTLSGSGSD